MKKLILLLCIISIVPLAALAGVRSDGDQVQGVIQTQGTIKVEALKPKQWVVSGVLGLNIGATTFVNWASGGSNSANGLAFANITLSHKKGRHEWITNLDTEFGKTYMDQPSYPWRNSNDKISFNTKYGYRFSGKWYVAVLGSFKSQYAHGYDYSTKGGVESRKYVSSWFSPSYTDVSVGVDYQPSSIISLYLSPLAGRLTTVADPLLRENYSLRADQYNRLEGGLNFKANLNYVYKKNLTVLSTLTLFTPYSETFGNFDVDWNLTFTYQILKVLSVSLMTTVKYYDGVLIANKHGHMSENVQFKNMIGIGVGYTF